MENERARADVGSGGAPIRRLIRGGCREGDQEERDGKYVRLEPGLKGDFKGSGILAPSPPLEFMRDPADHAALCLREIALHAQDLQVRGGFGDAREVIDINRAATIDVKMPRLRPSGPQDALSTQCTDLQDSQWRVVFVRIDDVVRAIISGKELEVVDGGTCTKQGGKRAVEIESGGGEDDPAEGRPDLGQRLRQSSFDPPPAHRKVHRPVQDQLNERRPHRLDKQVVELGVRLLATMISGDAQALEAPDASHHCVEVEAALRVPDDFYAFHSALALALALVLSLTSFVPSSPHSVSPPPSSPSSLSLAPSSSLSPEIVKRRLSILHHNVGAGVSITFTRFGHEERNAAIASMFTGSAASKALPHDERTQPQHPPNEKRELRQDPLPVREANLEDAHAMGALRAALAGVAAFYEPLQRGRCTNDDVGPDLFRRRGLPLAADRSGGVPASLTVGSPKICRKSSRGI
ncbi:hypothetical protein BDK51DRAFT_50132 [Blyttiomyces helicus]|uniref:Uncharacterized protein n=1 Tax=Blyttiomyces helicus TaxID=388810 RepID=A0A4P9WDX5_9FUNG|nr:hypothetical protein BDK51DRAFT_50132 [Blyttiomyces helicus]|eukprot:RKO89955.1 hypothetical protein BDK51DRAFT_50132 [Blyttiomyces helicus]